MSKIKLFFLSLFLMVALVAPITQVPFVFADDVPEFEWSIPAVGSEDAVFDYPNAVAIDSLGNIYVLDSGTSVIKKFSAEGNFILEWGEIGAGNGQLDSPEDLAIDSGDNVYVLDSANSRVQIFDTSGNYVDQWGEFGDGEGQINWGLTIDTDSSGNVYVYDDGATERVQKFTSEGVYIMTFGNGYGDGEGQFEYAEGLAVDDEGNVYVADTSLGRIQKFNSSGTLVDTWGDENFGPTSIDIDSDGNIYAVDTDSGTFYRIQKFDSEGNFILEWGEFGDGEGQFDYAEGIAVGADGSVYIADSNNQRVQKFSLPEEEPEPEPEPEDDGGDSEERSRSRRSGSIVYCNPPERVTFCRMRDSEVNTISTIQAQIDALMKEISALGGPSTSALLVRDLTIGMEGADVTALQNFLITQGHFIPAGPTGYFGAQTEGALAEYQAKVGITPAIGYFGPVTRQYLRTIGF